MKPVDSLFRRVVVVCTSAVIIVALVGFSVFVVVRSNNVRELEERRIEEAARKSKAQDDLEASKVRAAEEVRKAESKKRKAWERDAEGGTGGAGSPYKEGF